MQDIFGVAANWAEEDQPNLSLDDAVPGYGDGGSRGGSVFDDEATQPMKPENLLPGPTSSKKRR